MARDGVGGQVGLSRASWPWYTLGPPLAVEEAGGPLEAAEQGWHELSYLFSLHYLLLFIMIA